VKNSAKATLLNFSKKAVFLHDIMVSENEMVSENILCRGCADGVVAWVTLSANCQFELQVE